LGMEERVELLGGVFSIRSKPGDGTVLSIQFPLTKDRHIPPKDSI